MNIYIQKKESEGKQNQREKHKAVNTAGRFAAHTCKKEENQQRAIEDNITHSSGQQTQAE